MSNKKTPPHWQKCTPTYVAGLPELHFPFHSQPDIFAPASTALLTQDGNRVFTFIWCFLGRELRPGGALFDPSTLSQLRVQAMPLALQKLSTWFRFRNSRPSSVRRQLNNLGLFLHWADSAANAGRFEAVLDDPDTALEALRGYHSYLRSRLQGHQLAPSTAGLQDQDAIACLSEIHGRVYKDEIEPLPATKGTGTTAPDALAVQEFASTLQALFDSAVALLQGVGAAVSAKTNSRRRLLRVSASDDSKVVELKDNYSAPRLMELACVAFAGLAFVDSGANLAVLQTYEEPPDLEEQLAEPDRINLTQKSVKFRAGGRDVEVHMSATTMTRFRAYLRMRQALVNTVGSGDVAPLFVQCVYPSTGPREPVAVRPLEGNFLHSLRKKLKAVRVSLPDVTLRQLRAYKQQDLVRRAPVPVAARLMDHSIETAVQAYCKAQEATRQGEMTVFLGSLQKTVLTASTGLPGHVSETATPVGGCIDHGKPVLSSPSAVIQPNCSKVEGCFFCDNYRVHADEPDLRKLFSCRRVLTYIAPGDGDAVQAERVYSSVIGRIDGLLSELKRRHPVAHETARADVEDRGQLTRYWAAKLQQLHLLGMLPSR